MISLNKIHPGQNAIIENICGNDTQNMRLCALGFVPGACVCLYKKTSFNGPTIYDIQGAKIALRDFDAALVNVSQN